MRVARPFAARNGSTAMLENAFAPVRRECGLTRVGERMSQLIDRIELALEARQERRMLLGLNDGTLKDLGLSRGDAYAEGSRPFWNVPADQPKNPAR